MQSYGSAQIGSFDWDASSVAAAMQSFAGSQIKSTPMIAETLDRAAKMAGLAQSLADRASSLIAQLLGSAPTEAGSAGSQNAVNGEAPVIRQLNDRLTDTLSGLSRIDAQLGRLAAALG